MSIGSELYEQRIEAGEEKTRAKLIAAAFDRFEARQFHLKEVVTQSQVREMEPRLQNEVASVRLEAKSLKRENSGVAGRLRKAIRRAGKARDQRYRGQTATQAVQSIRIVGIPN